MPFWSSGQVEPKRQFRFKVSISGMPDSATFYARSVTKPSFTVTNATHKFLNHTFYYPGKVEWQTVTLSLVDPVAPDATGGILSILRNSGYQVPANLTDADSFTTIGKKNASENLGAIIIRAIDEDGADLEVWTLHNPFMVALKFNNYDYSGEDLATVDIDFRYDWASYEIPGPRADRGSLGAGVGGEVHERLFTLGGAS